MKTSPTLMGGGGAPFIGHGPTPEKPPVLAPPAGEGDLVHTMYGGVPYQDYPEGTTKLELLCWHNYRDQPMPKIFPSFEENQKMWQEIELDRMLDFQPAHEIHAKELPDYHFWPAICNEFEGKRSNFSKLGLEACGWEDRTDIPRFHKMGTVKTLPQQQNWYIAPLANGRFDWKKNYMVNAKQHLSYCSEEGWDARYYRRIFRPWIAGRSGSRASFVSPPLYFKHQEKFASQALARFLKGSFVSTGYIYLPFYCSVLAYAGSKWANYWNCMWPGDGPFNPDVMFLTQLSRDKGCYHDFL